MSMENISLTPNQDRDITSLRKSTVINRLSFIAFFRRNYPHIFLEHVFSLSFLTILNLNDMFKLYVFCKCLHFLSQEGVNCAHMTFTLTLESYYIYIKASVSLIVHGSCISEYFKVSLGSHLALMSCFYGFFWVSRSTFDFFVPTTA